MAALELSPLPRARKPCSGRRGAIPRKACRAAGHAAGRADRAVSPPRAKTQTVLRFARRTRPRRPLPPRSRSTCVAARTWTPRPQRRALAAPPPGRTSTHTAAAAARACTARYRAHLGDGVLSGMCARARQISLSLRLRAARGDGARRRRGDRGAAAGGRAGARAEGFRRRRGPNGRCAIWPELSGWASPCSRRRRRRRRRKRSGDGSHFPRRAACGDSAW